MLNGDRLHQIKLKSWVFTCQHERGPRHYRECLARAAKHSANQDNRAEIAAEIAEVEEVQTARPRRKKVNQRERFGPHISVYDWGGRNRFHLWVRYVRTTNRGSLSGIFDELEPEIVGGVTLYRMKRDEFDPIREWSDISAEERSSRMLGRKILSFFVANPGLQELDLPLRFGGLAAICPIDPSTGRMIPGATSYLDHTGKRFEWDEREVLMGFLRNRPRNTYPVVIG